MGVHYEVRGVNFSVYLRAGVLLHSEKSLQRVRRFGGITAPILCLH